MSEPTREQYEAAVRDFRQARRRAGLERVLARLTGRPADLLAYEDVATALQAGRKVELGVRDVPLDQIVGSVGRYRDFTRDFLPRSDSNEERWSRMRAHMMAGHPTEPVELYQVGDVYFVIDGNHRVSVSREMGAEHIQARVTEVETEMPLRPEDDVDDVLCRARRQAFLQDTGLDRTRPGYDFEMSAGGHYRFLEERIDGHRAYLERQRDQPVLLGEAVEHWFEEEYRPVIDIIRRQDLLRDFPERTETDLYVWVMGHRAELREELGWAPPAEQVVGTLVQQHTGRPARRLARLGGRLAQAVAPELLQGGPRTGEWRREWLAQRRQRQLFVDVLLILSDIDRGHDAQRLALEVARREEAELIAFYAVTEPAQLTSSDTDVILGQVRNDAADAGVPVEAAVEVVAPERVVSRTRWVDLVVAEVTNPPGPNPVAKLSSRFHNLLQRCPRPVLAVPPRTDSMLSSVLLAYDDSPKAREALYVSAYLAARWQAPLTVLSVSDASSMPYSLAEARTYLEERGVAADYVWRPGPVGSAIVAAAREFECDLIAMGGFSSGPLLELVLGSAVIEVLQAAYCPVLVCR